VERSNHHFCIFETAAGYCGLAWNAVGITRLQLPAATAGETERNLLRRLPAARAAAPPREIAAVVAAVTRYFCGERVDFSALQLDLGEQDDFFAKVYATVRRIEWGQTTTYGTVAKELGAGPEAARDVGQAMARNPVPLIIPCHRVLAAGGKVGGFSAPGGAGAKVRMLELEGIQLATPQPTQGSLGL
jgi:methylated-DNA-[protein]-cysteine S-methyltransferase